MSNDQAKRIHLILRLFQIENHDLKARVEAFEKVLLESPELHRKYETERQASIQNRRESTSLEQDIEAFRQSLQ